MQETRFWWAAVLDFRMIGLMAILGGGLVFMDGQQTEPSQVQSSAKGSPVKEKLVCPTVFPRECGLTIGGDFTGSYHHPCETPMDGRVLLAGEKGDQDTFGYSPSPAGANLELGITVLVRGRVQENLEYNASNAENMTSSLKLGDGTRLWSASYVSDPESGVPRMGSFQLIFCSVTRQPPYGAEVHGLVSATLEPNPVTSARAPVTVNASF